MQKARIALGDKINSTEAVLEVASVLAKSKSVEDRILVTDVLERVMYDSNRKNTEEAREILRPVLSGRKLPAIWVIKGESGDDSDDDVELSDKEIEKIKKRVPFVITKENEMLLRKKFRTAVKRGLIKPTVMTTAKRFDPKNDLMYAKYLRSVSSKYNGNITFVLSVEGADVFKHDLAGGFSSIIGLIETLGKEYYLKNLILQIIDGGMKERTGNLIALYRQQGLFPYPKRRAVEELFTTLGVLAMCYPDMGLNDRFWIANDTNVRFGNPIFGGKLLRELPKGRQMILYGKARKIMSKEDAGYIDSRLKQLGGWEMIKEKDLSEDERIKRILEWIENEQLPRRGVYTSSEGEITWFAEKTSRFEILKKAFNKAKIKEGEFVDSYLSENIFLMTLHKRNVDVSLIKRLATEDTQDGRKKFELEVSVFKSMVGARFVPEEKLEEIRNKDPKRICSPKDWRELVKIGKEVITYIIGTADYVEGSIARDIGTIKGVIDKWKVEAEQLRGKITENLFTSKGVKIRGNECILRDVSIYGNGEVLLGKKVILENVDIYLEDGQRLIISDGSIIVDSSLKGEVIFHGPNCCLFGVNFSPNTVYDLTERGTWELIERLDVYADEVSVILDRENDTSYIARAVTSLPYKGYTISELIKKERWGNWCRNHPRLLGVPGLSRWKDIKDKDFLNLPHYFGETLATARKRLVSEKQLSRTIIKV